jgi:hypothetical protein
MSSQNTTSWGSHSGENVDSGPLDCDAVWTHGQVLTFKKNIGAYM